MFSNRDPLISVNGLKYIEVLTGRDPTRVEYGISAMIRSFIPKENFDEIAKYVDVNDNTS